VLCSHPFSSFVFFAGSFRINTLTSSKQINFKTISRACSVSEKGTFEGKFALARILPSQPREGRKGWDLKQEIGALSGRTFVAYRVSNA
jgi:hypothetical protein